MTAQIDIPVNLEKELKDVVTKILKQSLEEIQQPIPHKEWMKLKEAIKYAGVSPGTFAKFREMGLKVCEIEGTKRVSKTEIDTFFRKHSV